MLSKNLLAFVTLTLATVISAAPSTNHVAGVMYRAAVPAPKTNASKTPTTNPPKQGASTTNSNTTPPGAQGNLNNKQTTDNLKNVMKTMSPEEIKQLQDLFSGQGGAKNTENDTASPEQKAALEKGLALMEKATGEDAQNPAGDATKQPATNSKGSTSDKPSTPASGAPQVPAPDAANNQANAFWFGLIRSTLT